MRLYSIILSVISIILLLFIADYNPKQETLSQPTNSNSLSSSSFPQIKPPDFITYDNYSFGIRFQAPADWNKMEFSSPRIIDIKFISVPTNLSDTFPATVDVVIEKALGNISSLDEYVESVDRLSNTTFSNFTIILSEPSTLGQSPAIYRIFNYDLVIPTIHLTIYQIITIHNEKAYVITYSAKSNNYNEHLASFQTAVNSFQFTR